MLDKPQLELIKGLIDMNLGEGIEEFEKPSTVIRDPILQVFAVHTAQGGSLLIFVLADSFFVLVTVIHVDVVSVFYKHT